MNTDTQQMASKFPGFILTTVEQMVDFVDAHKCLILRKGRVAGEELE